jgi:hypothetical protein
MLTIGRVAWRRLVSARASNADDINIRLLVLLFDQLPKGCNAAILSGRGWTSKYECK